MMSGIMQFDAWTGYEYSYKLRMKVFRLCIYGCFYPLYMLYSKLSRVYCC